MNFTAADCDVVVGANGVRDAIMDGDVKIYLEAQLIKQVSSASLGSIHLSINKTDLESTGGHLLNVGYDGGVLDGHTIATQVRYGFPPLDVEGPTVVDRGGGRFEFTGPIMVAANGVGGRNGKRGRRSIAVVNTSL